MSKNKMLPTTTVGCLDISSRALIENICSCLDDGNKVQILSIESYVPGIKSDITFIGKSEEQGGTGMTVSSYKKNTSGCLIQID